MVACGLTSRGECPGVTRVERGLSEENPEIRRKPAASKGRPALETTWLSLPISFFPSCYAAGRRGWTCAAISWPVSISARRSAQVCCRFSHSCGVVPKYRASRRAVSAVTPRWPCRSSVIRFTGTPSARASALGRQPERVQFLAQDFSRMHRSHPIFRVHDPLPSVIVYDLYVVWPVCFPPKTEPPLRVNPDAVVASPVPA